MVRHDRAQMRPGLDISSGRRQPSIQSPDRALGPAALGGWAAVETGRNRAAGQAVKAFAGLRRGWRPGSGFPRLRRRDRGAGALLRAPPRQDQPQSLPVSPVIFFQFRSGPPAAFPRSQGFDILKASIARLQPALRSIRPLQVMVCRSPPAWTPGSASSRTLQRFRFFFVSILDRHLGSAARIRASARASRFRPIGDHLVPTQGIVIRAATA